MREYIVTLKNKNDLEEFYNDMETPGGNLYIPDRAVELTNRRTISRNTHYMLTDEEAESIRNDPRVLGVEIKEILDISIRPMYTTEVEPFDKTFNVDQNHKNWGLLRHVESSNRTNWGADGTATINDSITITASGKNVDVVIFDGHVDPTHPEFAVNSDGSGGTRVIQYNWFQNDIGQGTGTYVYDRSGSYVNPLDVDDNDHGCHVAGTVVGNTQGWARGANIYNISPYPSNPNGNINSTMFDYVRAWHNQKPINPITGRPNPTVTNHSYGSFITWNTGDFGPIVRVNYRNSDFNPGRDLTVQEMQARGFYTADLTPTIPYYSTALDADIQDAISDGIIVVASAGNNSWKTVTSADPDYNNTYYATFQGSGPFLWSGLHRGGGPSTYSETITVGATSYFVDERKASFSNCGDKVDIYAAGQAIQSSVNSATSTTDPRNSSYYLAKYQGTSMSAPQVTGILALLAETWPNMNQSQARQWLQTYALKDQMFDSGTTDPMDLTSLQGSLNYYLRWINQRKETGTSYPNNTYAVRPVSKKAYPRSRLRRKG